MKIFRTNLTAQERYAESRARYKEASPSQQSRILVFKVVEMAKNLKSLWHPNHLKSRKDTSVYVGMRKQINAELGSSFTSKK